MKAVNKGTEVISVGGKDVEAVKRTGQLMISVRHSLIESIGFGNLMECILNKKLGEESLGNW